jgi:hypothetical protein
MNDCWGRRDQNRHVHALRPSVFFVRAVGPTTNRDFWNCVSPASFSLAVAHRGTAHGNTSSCFNSRTNVRSPVEPDGVTRYRHQRIRRALQGRSRVTLCQADSALHGPARFTRTWGLRLSTASSSGYRPPSTGAWRRRRHSSPGRPFHRFGVRLNKRSETVRDRA